MRGQNADALESEVATASERSLALLATCGTYMLRRWGRGGG